jgi:polo-like kinase 1
MKAEIGLHSKLRHPGIVQYISHYQTQDEYVIVLELCRYRSLQDVLDKRTILTEPEVQYYLLQILDSLEYLHAEQIVHRDIKPENIFLQKGLKTKIGDFGLSIKLDDVDERRL